MPKTEPDGILDTGSTGHYVSKDCPGEELPYEKTDVSCANRQSMTNMKTLALPFTGLPLEGRKGQAFNEVDQSMV